MSSSSKSYSSHPSSSSSSEDGYERHKEERKQLRNLLFTQIVQAQNEPPQNFQTQNRTRRRFIDRNREDGQQQLYNDYFAEDPVYTDRMFRRRFRMRRPLFLRLVSTAECSDTYFQQKADATGRLGLTSLQKCTAAIRILAYGESSDRVDEYLRLGESTTRKCLMRFTNLIIDQFGTEYLRSPTVDDTQRLLQIGASRGFPGMLGSIDCMHWKWKNCPVAGQGQFQGRSSNPSIILEAIASQDLWIWHSFFGTPGSANDLNVLHRSPVFDALLNGYAPRVNYTVNGNNYDTGYYLTDGIYPKWSTVIQSIKLPQTPKDRLFANKQESVRKDVERAFGVLQARFAIIRKPALSWDATFLHKIITACIILHNMIVEDERDSYAGYDNVQEYMDQHSEEEQGGVENPEYEVGYVPDIHQFVANRNNMQDPRRHQALRKDLIEHIWQRFGHLD